MEDHRGDGQPALIATRGLHHLAIRVRDLAAAERFYCGVLGLAVVRRWPAADGDGERSIWVDTGNGAFLALEQGAGNRGRNTDGDGEGEGDDDTNQNGLFLAALTVDARDRQAWRERLSRAGVAIYHHTRFTIYVRDPEGNRVGLSHYPVASDEG